MRVVDRRRNHAFDAERKRTVQVHVRVGAVLEHAQDAVGARIGARIAGGIEIAAQVEDVLDAAR